MNERLTEQQGTPNKDSSLHPQHPIQRIPGNPTTDGITNQGHLGLIHKKEEKNDLFQPLHNKGGEDVVYYLNGQTPREERNKTMLGWKGNENGIKKTNQ